jgi:hypothetical protein
MAESLSTSPSIEERDHPALHVRFHLESTRHLDHFVEG